jgi:hypothetical protein
MTNKPSTTIVPASQLSADLSLSPRDYLPQPMPKKWQLLPETHPTVLRRLVRELNNHSVNGFYFNGERYNRARFSKGHVVVSFCGENDATLLDYVISDPYGNTITASRTLCGA